MPEEATLDAFVQDADDEGDEAAAADPESASDASVEPDAVTAEADQGSVEPAAVTSSWVRDGGSCSACGEPAGRLWQDGGQRVCETCKPWTRAGEDTCDQ